MNALIEKVKRFLTGTGGIITVLELIKFVLHIVTAGTGVDPDCHPHVPGTWATTSGNP